MEVSDRRALAPRPMIVGYCILAGAATLAYGLTAMSAPRRRADLGIVMLATLAGVTITAATRAWRRPEERRMWSLVAACIAADLAAQLIYRVTEPSPLAFYPPVALACLLLAGAFAGATVCEALRTRVQAWTSLRVLDALIAGLAVAAVVTATLARTTHLTSNAPVYLLLGITAGGMIVSLGLMGWRADLVVKLGATGLALGAASWALTAQSVAAGNYVRGGIAGTLFIASVAVTGAAAFFGPRPLPPHVFDRRQLIVPPVFAALALIVLLTQGADAAGPAGYAPSVLAGLTLALVLARLTLALDDAQRLVLASHDSLTDGLTGIGNRRRFTRDLERAYADGTDVTLALFDLDGFKLYNDTFGHPAGDVLLVRLAARFAAVVGPERAYRIGGDEFCTLLPLAPDTAERIVGLAAESLTERAGACIVTSSHGVAHLPDDAPNATSALKLVDERMYRRKGERSELADRHARAALLQVLSEREPHLHGHMHDVAALARGVARRLGIDEQEVRHIERGAELHDIGKMAIPDEVLHKPGPLDPEEWGFIRQHTVIGERILRAVPAFEPAATIVRASHERWDGRGYPDGLAGECIPLGARIVAACDAYHAMREDRCYAAKMSSLDAAQELLRCSGTQFDPAVVDALQAELGASVGQRTRPAVRVG